MDDIIFVEDGRKYAASSKYESWRLVLVTDPPYQATTKLRPVDDYEMISDTIFAYGTRTNVLAEV